MNDAPLPVLLLHPTVAPHGRFPLTSQGSVRADPDGLVFEGDARIPSFIVWWTLPKYLAVIAAVALLSVTDSAFLLICFYIACWLLAMVLRYLPLRETRRVEWSEIAGAVPFGNGMRIGTKHGEVVVLPTALWVKAELAELGDVIVRNATGGVAVLPPIAQGRAARWALGIALVVLLPMVVVSVR